MIFLMLFLKIPCCCWWCFFWSHNVKHCIIAKVPFSISLTLSQKIAIYFCHCKNDDKKYFSLHSQRSYLPQNHNIVSKNRRNFIQEFMYKFNNNLSEKKRKRKESRRKKRTHTHWQTHLCQLSFESLQSIWLLCVALSCLAWQQNWNLYHRHRNHHPHP